MYEQFFGLCRRPFAAAPDADCYFPATAIETARQTLFRCIDRGEGAGLLIGPAGAGKSLLLQVLAEQFKERFELALLGSGRLGTLRELLQAILYELGLPYRDLQEGELRLALIDHLSATRRLEAAATEEREGLLLLIDEAHTLPLKLLEEVRLITNLIRDGQPKVRLVLAGSAALEERFTSPKLDAFNQRISARCYLAPFDRAETLEYIKAQIEWAAGQSEKLFTREALDAVYQATHGVPRLINQICDHALVLACNAGVTSLDKASIERAWADLQQLPAPANHDAGDAPQNDAGNVIEFGVLDDDPHSVDDEMPNPSLSSGVDADDAVVLSSDEESIEIDVSEPVTCDESGNQQYDIQFEPMLVDSSEMPYHESNAARPPEFGYRDPLSSLRQVEQQIAAMDCEYQPNASLSPQIDLSFEDAFDPFCETFAEEELVIDPFAMTTADALANRPLVQCAEGRTLAAFLKPLPEPPAPKLSLAAAAETEFDAGDGEFSHPTYRLVAESPPANRRRDISHDNDGSEPELIVIEDEPSSVHQVTVVRRGQYRRLFSSMLRG